MDHINSPSNMLETLDLILWFLRESCDTAYFIRNDPLKAILS